MSYINRLLQARIISDMGPPLLAGRQHPVFLWLQLAQRMLAHDHAGADRRTGRGRCALRRSGCRCAGKDGARRARRRAGAGGSRSAARAARRRGGDQILLSAMHVQPMHGVQPRIGHAISIIIVKGDCAWWPGRSPGAVPPRDVSSCRTRSSRWGGPAACTACCDNALLLRVGRQCAAWT